MISKHSQTSPPETRLDVTPLRRPFAPDDGGDAKGKKKKKKKK